MSEIEKLMQNASVEKEWKPLPYGDIEEYYPELTAEKQLELIKWLAKTRQVHITYLLDNWIIEGFERYGKRYDSFELALAGLFNNLWQDMTNTEKQQIKEILK